MQNHKDNFQGFDENALFEVAVLSVIGGREEQQDSVGYDIRPDEGFAVICDGMGGHNGGKLASALAVDLLVKTYTEVYPAHDMHEILVDTVEEADRKVAAITDDDGNRLHAGSTVAAAFIRGHILHWVSVGDSRIYLFRNGELVQATEDHTYQLLLDERRASGEIGEEAYRTESQKGEALISFLGVNGLPRISTNDTPFPLLQGDKVLMMSDGLYKLVSDEEIGRILDNFSNIQDALKALDLKAQRAAKNSGIQRDNMTVVLIKIK